jgi:hypothetical protein
VITVVLLATLGCGCGRQQGASPRQTSDQPAAVAVDETISGETLEGKRFISKEQREIGLGESGEVLGVWHLEFTEGSVTWDHSDVREVGNYQLNPDGSIVAWVGDDQPVHGFYHIIRREVLWEGMWYELVDQ